MTPSEYQTVRATIIRVWPRVAQRMTETDWKIIAQKCAGLDVTPDQAEAALEELKATDEKYPSVAKFIATIRKCEVRKIRTADEAVVESIGPGARLAQMRLACGMGADAPDGEVVRAFHIAAARRSIEIRGYLRESWTKNAHKDLIEIGHYSPEEADEWVFLVAGQCPTEPAQTLTTKQAWYFEFIKQNPKADPDAYTRHWAKSHAAVAPRDNDQRARTISQISDLADNQNGVRS